METYNALEIVEKLTGEIDPVGDSSIDSIRRLNLVEYIDLSWNMLVKMKSILNSNKDSERKSVIGIMDDIKQYFDVVKEIIKYEES